MSRVYTIPYPGPPTANGAEMPANAGDAVTDSAGVDWYCTVGGTPGTWTGEAGTGGGTVTGVSVASAHGLAGTATSTATPVITLSTSITGVLKGDGTSISAASAGTDYLAPAGSGAALTGIAQSQVSGSQAGPLTGDVTTSGAAATLKNTGTAGTVGDATHVAATTTDAQGRVTGMTATAITGLAESAITGLVTDLGNKQAGPLTGDVTTSGAAATLVGTTNVENIVRANSPDQLATMAGNLPFGGFKGTGAAVATASGDLATFQQLPLSTIFTGLFTTVASGSNGTNINTFTSAGGTLNVASNVGACSTGGFVVLVKLVPDGGAPGVITYTGLSGTTQLTGCTFVSGAFSMTTGGQVALPVAFTPTVTGAYRSTLVAGGGGGGGAGTPATSGTNQAGGGGGGVGGTSLGTSTLTAGTTYAVTVGFGGLGGAGAAAGSAAGGLTGGTGGQSILAAAPATEMLGAVGGSSGLLSGATTATGVIGGAWASSLNLATATSTASSPGCGGTSSSFSGYSSPGAGPLLSAGGGGGGGSSSTSTVGGGGGGGGTILAGGALANPGASGTHSGLAGGNGTVNTGAGGGGGGGGCGAATIGAGGNGGNGGAGFVEIVGPFI